ncbi:bifunctional diaminohydroxyphosphoribosylaminopyrimidine deaminase/5-amino-6-(5-phosphoribosylamino)uracil reductase RibD [Pelagibius sp.]|uniref:bifunctional diaminohydroxyphosphoribosylaminopyrimidine deaminase/5-amino-6-(5-phosphoribosylamino)uracil reductase RibD n=1 Tax=Pelagibius sp. TaxID=1931238 RepID=UPI0026266168|nr:bifunctional diaminohydroxyphosphoribosylaminopyrimidine deaminase/5-amino-6-(5-phosphoribosylamino)uracil reductase RibD [Pelagibius sp.]
MTETTDRQIQGQTRSQGQDQDRAFMEAALGLAARGLGSVAPNPAVGCVLVREGRIVGRGWTQPGGRPHAETEALDRAQGRAAGATAYVTLEPCSHHGRTPPCAEALVEAGIARAVVAVEDPDPRVSGRGLARLREAGVAVDLGLCGDAARDLNAGFFSRLLRGRPDVTLKLATSQDGRIATHKGHSQWITGPLSRRRAHLLRARADAVLVGSGTAVLDNPRLDVRLPGLERSSPLRVVVDGRLRLPLTHDLVARAAEAPTLLITHDGNPAERLRAYADAGVEVLQVGKDAFGHCALEDVLKGLAERGVNTLLVEGGGHLGAALLRQGLVDRLAWFRAALVIGGDGVPALASFGVDRVDEAPQFIQSSRTALDGDVLERLRSAD